MSISPNTVDAGGVVIVGAGLAGLFCALKLAPLPVTLLSPVPLGQGASSAWAQGGVAAAVGPGDSPLSHAEDTERAGAGIVDPLAARSITGEAAARIEDLARWGAPFDRDAAGFYLLSREAAHSHNRVVRVSGDRAGKAIMEALVARVRQTPSIRVLEGVLALDLLQADGAVAGVFCTLGGEPVVIGAGATVLAAGGLGGLYAITTNPPGVRGQAMGMAARAGARIADPEFVQFHPTAIATGADPAPLATEALRGEGATLVTADGHRFMPAIHPDAELAPRDIVARAIFRQIKAGERVFLDTRAVLGARILTAYPTVAASCREAGIDPVAEPIPVIPAAHYHMGGVAVDARGRASLEGLWVAGEASATGLHGANRLASNSLLEAIVYGGRIAEALAGAEPGRARTPEAPHAGGGGSEDREAVAALRATMTRLVGVERDGEGLRAALRDIRGLEARAGGAKSFLNMSTAATLVAAGALTRTESRGGHFRTDHPEPDPAWARRSFMTLDEALAVRDGV